MTKKVEKYSLNQKMYRSRQEQFNERRKEKDLNQLVWSREVWWSYICRYDRKWRANQWSKEGMQKKQTEDQSGWKDEEKNQERATKK